MTNNIEMKKLKNNRLPGQKKKLIFYLSIAIPLILQVAIFYIYVNVSTWIIAFREYVFVEGTGQIGSFAGLNNFKSVLTTVFSSEKIGMFGTSLLMYAFILFGMTPITIFFSYYVYKKYVLSEFFRVILFLPQVISAVVMTMLYRYFVNDIYIEIFHAEKGLLSVGGFTTIMTVIIYQLWMGFGANILLMSGAMSGINESIVESSHLDGCTTMKEFWYITLPSVYPTIVTFAVIDIAGIFSNQMNLFTFFGQDADLYVSDVPVGYYMYVNTLKSDGLSSGGSSWLTYPQISALGIVITLFVLPVTLAVKKIMEKLGPSED